jgi:hypothetical protein
MLLPQPIDGMQSPRIIVAAKRRNEALCVGITAVIGSHSAGTQRGPLYLDLRNVTEANSRHANWIEELLRERLTYQLMTRATDDRIGVLVTRSSFQRIRATSPLTVLASYVKQNATGVRHQKPMD